MTLQLQEGVHFTPKRLADLLNEKFGQKKTGVQFSINDVLQYAIRGNLPKAYGGNKIVWCENESIGIKVLEVNQLK